MKHIFLTVLILWVFNCCNNSDSASVAGEKDTSSKSTDTVPINISLDTVTALKDQQDSLAIFKSPTGKTYKTMQVLGDEDSIASLKSALHCEDDNFHGTDRKAAKISLSNAAMESVPFDNFLGGLVKDNLMIAKNISRGSTSNRVKEEKRNVKLTGVFLYAIKRESDNDYHVIIGNAGATKFFNIENSGLPPSSAAAFQKLKSVRKTIEDFFGELCSTKYQVFDPGIPIEVEGSLFYDVDHAPGVVGPAGFKPKTSWEIHPISKIVFKD
jgi:hypothetical protein